MGKSLARTTPRTANEHEAKVVNEGSPQGDDYEDSYLQNAWGRSMTEDREADHLFGVVRVQFVTRT